MTTISHEPPTAVRRTAWFVNRDLWASLAISAMWFTVMVVSLWARTFTPMTRRAATRRSRPASCSGSSR